MGAPRKKYNASIFLEVTTPIGREYDVEEVEHQILQADRECPWQETFSSGSPAPSIGFMSGVEVKKGHYIDRLHTLEIRPCFLLSWEQLRAYERYGTALAERLARIVDSEKVIRVDSRLEVRGTSSGGYDPRTLQPR